METKKNESADLTRKSSYFFSIGLLIATSLMVMAFEWRQYDKGIIDLVGKIKIQPKNLSTFPQRQTYLLRLQLLKILF